MMSDFNLKMEGAAIQGWPDLPNIVLEKAPHVAIATYTIVLNLYTCNCSKWGPNWSAMHPCCCHHPKGSNIGQKGIT